MRKLLLTTPMILVAGAAQAQYYSGNGFNYNITIAPRMPSISGTHSRLTRPGTPLNPYVIRRNGQIVGEIRPRTYDYNPNDGIMDAGTWSNPYVIRSW